MDRNNPYEAAFEGYLKTQGLCYVGVDEGRRAMLGEMPVKNLDFIVLGACGSRLLIDVKGRQFPGGPPEKPKYTWENWATNDDINGLRNWVDVFGPGYTALFLFLYKLQPTVEVAPDTIDLFTFREQQYLLRAVTLDDYVNHMKVRSPKWGTVSLPGTQYRTLARPFRFFTHELIASADNREDRDHGPDAVSDLSQSLDSALASLAPHGLQARSDGS
jgi:hypothetical protein